MKHRSPIQSAALAVHRRNGGIEPHLGFSLRLFDPSLRLDSMEYAEIVAELERRWELSPVDNSVRPVTRGEFATLPGARVDSGKKAAE
jgi:hypothetical protein